jgi:hypothetical protein
MKVIDLINQLSDMDLDAQVLVLGCIDGTVRQEGISVAKDGGRVVTIQTVGFTMELNKRLKKAVEAGHFGPVPVSEQTEAALKTLPADEQKRLRRRFADLKVVK